VKYGPQGEGVKGAVGLEGFTLGKLIFCTWEVKVWNTALRAKIYEFLM
jgi:hypothetical protein